VYAIIRTQTLLFPDSPLTGPLLWAALFTLLAGILGAVAQSDIKRMLSFTLVSHIGYMVFGVGLGTAAGYSGAIFYVTHHITIQTTLFLVLGLVERQGGSTSLIKLGGLAGLAPVVGVLFFVPAMNLAGIPPMSGFLGKASLVEAAIRVGTVPAYAVVAGGMLTSLLTLYAVGRTWNLAFWRTPEEAHEMIRELSDRNPLSGPDDVVPYRDRVRIGAGTYGVHDQVEARSVLDEEDDTSRDLFQLTEQGLRPTRLPRTMVGATAGLAVFSLGLTVVAGALFGYTGRAADDLLDPGRYVSSVLTQEAR